MKIRKSVFFLVVFLPILLLASSVQALRVKEIHPDTGVLTLDDSRQVKLIGIRLTSEAVKSLAILFSNQDIEIEEEKGFSAPGLPAVYMQVKTLEIPFPFVASIPPRSSKLALNEMLISSGLASVDEGYDFKKKEHYLTLQAEASRLGKGMWSEEPTLKKKS